MRNNFFQNVFVILSELVLLTISIVAVWELDILQGEYDILEQNNLNLNSENEYLKEINKLMIFNKLENQKQINNLTNQLKKLENEREKLINELSMEYRTQNQLKESIKQAKKERGLINPTFKQLKRFIRTDETDKNIGSDKYDCTEFSNDFVSNFAKKGYDSGIVEIDYTKGNEKKRLGHIIVAVNTTDKGLVYVEPQTDDIIKDINVNDNYCDLINWDCKWSITKISSKFEFKI